MSPEAIIVVLKILLEIFTRRATDPAFVTASDAAFAAHANAKTEEEKLNAQKAIMDLMSSGS
jgi:hypothetical protein